MSYQKTTSNQAAIWVVIPASGVGSRMENALPKQYMAIHGKTIMQHTLEKIEKVKQVVGVVLVVNPNDDHIKQIDLSRFKNMHLVHGGQTRADSVLNGLEYIQRLNKANAKQAPITNLWALVHDCARPCVSVDDIHRLIDTCLNKNIGGILAEKVNATVKMANIDDPSLIAQTQDRTYLWLAQTPQFFHLEQLINAIKQAKNNNATITDEASAIEHQNNPVLLISSPATNIKITTAQDMTLASVLLN